MPTSFPAQLIMVALSLELNFTLSGASRTRPTTQLNVKSVAHRTCATRHTKPSGGPCSPGDILLVSVYRARE